MKFSLNTLQLKTFFQNSSMIKSNNLLPVLSYIKIEDSKIIKTNLQAFISMDITPTGVTMLIDENILNSLVKATTSDEIKVEVKGNRVHMTDGRNKTFFALSNDVEHYPKFPDSQKEQECRLEEPVLKAIGVALKNTVPNVDGFDSVHLGHGYIFASDNVRYYLKKIGDSLPTIIISPLAAGIVSQFSGANFYEQGNFYFFEIGNTLYGFKKSEVKAKDFTTILRFTCKEPYVEIDTDEVIKFIDFLSSTTQSLVVTCDFKKDKLSFYDSDIEKGNDVDLTTTGTYVLEKSFLPKQLSAFLRSLGHDYIRISPMKDNMKGVTLWHKDDEDFVGTLAEVTFND